MRISPIIAVLVLFSASPANALQSSSAVRADSTHDAVKAARLWWRAFAVGDTAYLRARTAQRLSLTLSAGHVFDRRSMLARATTHIAGPPIEMGWSEESVNLHAKDAAVVHSRNKEVVGPNTRYFRYTTVLGRVGGRWQVFAAQSTREVEPSRRIPMKEAANLTDFAGSYRTQNGRTIRIAVRDSALSLVDPSGAELRLEPIGPGMFEPATMSLAGSLRFVFTRDAAGRVTALSRLSDGVTTYPRTDSSNR